LWFRLVAKRSTWGRSHRRTTESNTTCRSSHSVLTGLWKRDRQSASTLKVPRICLTTRWMCDRRLLALQHFKTLLVSKAVVLVTDNTTVVAYLQNQGGTRCHALFLLCKEILLLVFPWRLESVYRVREGTGWSKATPVKTFSLWVHQI
jgi:hypothetical protein